MPKVNLNLNDIKDYAPEGWYLLKVVNAEIKEGPKGQYINWQLEISDPEFDQNVPPVWHITSYSAPSMVRDFLEACKFEWDEDGSFFVEDVLGYELEGKLVVGEYNGRQRNELEKVRPL